MKLLIIDDDSVSAFVSTWVAKNSGLFRHIQSVESGKHGIEVLEQASLGMTTAPDLVLLDLSMPVISGFDVLEYVKGLSFPGRQGDFNCHS